MAAHHHGSDMPTSPRVVLHHTDANLCTILHTTVTVILYLFHLKMIRLLQKSYQIGAKYKTTFFFSYLCCFTIKRSRVFLTFPSTRGNSSGYVSYNKYIPNKKIIKNSI